MLHFITWYELILLVPWNYSPLIDTMPVVVFFLLGTVVPVVVLLVVLLSGDGDSLLGMVVPVVVPVVVLPSGDGDSSWRWVVGVGGRFSCLAGSNFSSWCWSHLLWWMGAFCWLCFHHRLGWKCHQGWWGRSVNGRKKSEVFYNRTFFLGLLDWDEFSKEFPVT